LFGVRGRDERRATEALRKRMQRGDIGGFCTAIWSVRFGLQVGILVSPFLPETKGRGLPE